MGSPLEDLSKGKLIFNKQLKTGEGGGGRVYHLRAWDNNSVEFRRAGYGTRPGWTAFGVIKFSPEPTLTWTNLPDTGEVDPYDQTIISSLVAQFEQWVSEYADILQEERMDAESEWSLL